MNYLFLVINWSKVKHKEAVACSPGRAGRLTVHRFPSTLCLIASLFAAPLFNSLNAPWCMAILSFRRLEKPAGFLRRERERFLRP